MTHVIMPHLLPICSRPELQPGPKVTRTNNRIDRPVSIVITDGSDYEICIFNDSDGGDVVTDCTVLGSVQAQVQKSS